MQEALYFLAHSLFSKGRWQATELMLQLGDGWGRAIFDIRVYSQLMVDNNASLLICD